MSKVSFTLAVRKDQDLPLVFMGLAQRVIEFNFKDDRGGESRAFLVSVNNIPRARAAEILDLFGAVYVHKLTLAEAA